MMDIKPAIVKQNMEMFFKETFYDVILQFGDSVYFCGRKMYIKINHIVIAIEFQGTNVAQNTIVLTASSQYGIIDQNITPLFLIFKESKIPSGLEKIVNLKVVLGATGEYTVVWSAPLKDNDKMNINNFVINYVELFSNL